MSSEDRTPQPLRPTATVARNAGPTASSSLPSDLGPGAQRAHHGVVTKQKDF